MRKILPPMNPPTLKMTLGDSLTAEQIINACKSGKWTPEQIIMVHNFGVPKLINHFNLNPKLSTNELKHMIIDRLNAIIKHSQKPHKGVSCRLDSILFHFRYKTLTRGKR